MLEKAQLEYEDSILWYAKRSKKAAENFVVAVDAALYLICNNPLRWRNKYKNFHELGLKKYPFSVIYIIEPENQLIVVTSIYHHKRSAGKRYKK